MINSNKDFVSFLDFNKNTIQKNVESNFFVQDEIENKRNNNYDMTETLINNRMNLRKINMKNMLKNQMQIKNGFLDNVHVSNCFNDEYLIINEDELPSNMIPEKFLNINESYVRR